MNYKTAALIFLVATLVLSGCTGPKTGSNVPEKTTAEIHLRVLDRNLILVDSFQEFPKATVALTALKQMAQLQLTSTDRGQIVTGVNDLRPTPDRKLVTFVNGEEYTTGLDSLTLTADITVEFRLLPSGPLTQIPAAGEPQYQ